MAKQAALELPNCAGIKDSSGNMQYVHTILTFVKKDNPNFSVLLGPEDLIADGVLFGADGAVPGGANVTPQLFVDLYEAAAADQPAMPQVRDLHNKVLLQRKTLYSIGKYESKSIKALKSALSVMQICSDRLAPPFNAFLAPERKMVQDGLNFLHQSGVPGIKGGSASSAPSLSTPPSKRVKVSVAEPLNGCAQDTAAGAASYP